MVRRFIILCVCVVISVVSGLHAEDPAATITAKLKVAPFREPQPSEGTMRFVGSPGYAKPCSVLVNLTYLKKVRTGETFRMDCGEACGLAVSPDSIIWAAPIDSGHAFSTYFVFTPQEVGTYQVTLMRKMKAGWHSLTSLTLALSEDGKTLYAGASTECRLNTIPLHPLRTSQPLTVRFPIKGRTFDPVSDNHFVGEFRFSKPPAVNDTVWVDFSLECLVPNYTQVQFILDYSTNLKTSDLPKSWGEEIRLNDSSRFYSGHFWFLAQKAGFGVLNLRVVGKRSNASFAGRAITELPIYFAIDNDGKFVMMSSFEPWTRYKTATDPMLGGLASLIDVTNREYKLKQVLSKPDYIDEANPIPPDSAAKGK